MARVLAQGYSLRGVPTLLVLDGEGREVLRQVGSIDRGAVLEAIETMN